MDAPEDPALMEFVERMGLSLQEEGWPRIAGRMMALLVVVAGPLSSAELCERLRISRASASTNARLLRHLGILERVSRPGERQDLYRLAAAPYAGLLDGYLARMRERCEIVRTMRAALPGDAHGPRRRLDRLHRFYEAAIEATGALGDRVRAVEEADPEDAGRGARGP